MKKFLVTYTPPIRQEVTLAVTAVDSIEAIRMAREAAGDVGAIAFEAVEIKGEYPRSEPVMHLNRVRKAIEACAALVAAYAEGDVVGGSIEWSDIDAAYELALEVIPEPAEQNSAPV